ncbi:hypothetical protein HY338_00580 [Candidatus Gottesmanbacteria bacterium]|nr:hypothetical protein [Candidatus Gottesmanbacteria bacterium]
MSSSRIILIFLGFIFIIIVILSSTKIAGALRARFGKFIPGGTVTSDISLTPTNIMPTITITPKPTNKVSVPSTNKGGQPVSKSSPTSETPATGPAETAWLIISGSLLTGIGIRKLGNLKAVKKN